MKKGLNNKLAGQIGEYLVCAELGKRGYIATSFTPADTFSKSIDKISRKEIKQHLRSVYKKRSPATVEAVHGVISGVYEEAIDDEIISANPARGLLNKILPPKNLIEKEKYFLNVFGQTADSPEELLTHLGLDRVETAPDDIAALFVSKRG